MEAGRAPSDVSDQPDVVVAMIAWTLAWLQRLLNLLIRAPLERLIAAIRRSSEPWLYTNYIYILVWLGVEAVALIAVTAATWPQVILVALSIWRYAELVVWHVKLLFDRDHRNILSVERNLLFLILNAAEALLISAMILRLAAAGVSVSESWLDALSIFSLNGKPEGYEGFWADFASTVGSVTGFLLIAAGLGALLGVMSDRLRETPGKYTGPVIPPPPWRRKEDPARYSLHERPQD